MHALVQDVRHALRTFARRPLVASGVVASLAIGIAANTAVFGIVNGVLLRKVPGVTRPERLVEIARDAAGATADVTFPMYGVLKAQTGTVDDLAAYALEGVSIAAGGAASVRGALAVTANYFDLLGVRAARGRVFARDEALYPSVAPVVVISHELWQREFGGAEDVVGREARVNGAPVRVIGVLPRGFAGHHTGLLVDVFLPLGLDIPGLPDPATFSAGTGSSLELLGRLRTGVTPAQAERALSPVADAFGRETGESSEAHRYALDVSPWGPLPSTVRSGVAAFLSVLFVLVGLGLTMACINVSTILLAQASERQRELAVRRAIGASEGRLVRQIVTEVGVLFAIAGVIGTVAAGWATSLISGIQPPVPLPGRLGADFSVDPRVVLFSVVLTLAAALAFTLVPAFRASRFDLVRTLREAGATDGRGRSRLRSVLVGVQVAMTCAMLAATLMFGRALTRMRSIRPGWNGDGVLVASIDLQQNGTTPAAGLLKQRELLERLGATPGVEVASLATKLPAGGRSSFGLVSVPGVEPAPGLPGFDAALNRVSSGYFRTMRIELLAGRDIAPTDVEGAPLVAVINATMARRIWPNGDPVGRSFFINLQNGRLEFRVVGVVGDAQQRAPDQAPENFYYVPEAQWYNPAVVLHVRAEPGAEANVVAAVERVVQAVDRALPVPVVRPLNEALGVFLLPQRLAAWVSGAMGLFGLLLAAIGIYGLMAFLVSRRSREMAIRVALGATDGDVVRLLLVQGGRAPLIGLAVGLVLATAFTIGASTVVVGARADDPVVIAAVPALLAMIAVGAMLTPVLRLLRRPPMERLRED